MTASTVIPVEIEHVKQVPDGWAFEGTYGFSKSNIPARPIHRLRLRTGPHST